jgi:hypothetical protein
MGNARWDSSSYSSFTSTSTAGRSTDEVFSKKTIQDEMNPRLFKNKRESRDSDKNPQSNAIIIGCDVTGSMGIIADNLIRKGIGTTFEEILKRAADPAQKMITDPHLMVLGIGDALYDRAPIQATQFEADIKIAEQLKDIYLEHGGGGNNVESYDLAWYLAAAHTSIDCFEKRGKKGYLFTVGDECAPLGLTEDQINKFFGGNVQDGIKPKQLLEVVNRTYNVFHIIIEEGNYAQSHLPSVRETWRNLLGQQVISLGDYTKLAETIISAIQVHEGMSVTDTAKTWDGATARVVADALVALGS